MSLSLPHFQLDSPQELLPCEVPGGHEPPQPSPGRGQDEAAAGKAQGRAELLAPARDARAAGGERGPSAPREPPRPARGFGRFLRHTRPLLQCVWLWVRVRGLEYVSN